MKAILKSLLAMVASFATSYFMAIPVNMATGTDIMAATCCIFSIKFAVNVAYTVARFKGHSQTAATLNEVSVEIWVSYILDRLFKNNEFLNLAFNADEYVVGGKIVHIPVAGSLPEVVKNRTTLPATAVIRMDKDILYGIDNYSTNPTVITDAEMAEISYNKMDSVLGGHLAVLKERVAEEIMIKWVTSTGGMLPDYVAQQLRTLGASTAASAPGATGNRKKFTKESIKAGRKLFNKGSVPTEDRYCLLSSEQMDELHDDADLKTRALVNEMDMRNGIIERLYGFQIIERASALTFNNASTPVVKVYGAAPATTDNEAALLWQKDCVERAMGEVTFYENKQDALYQGDIYSGAVRMGGRIRRTEGVATIIQAAA